MHINIMDCRVRDLTTALSGLQKTGVPLVAFDGQRLKVAGLPDDAGSYYFIPKLALLLHTPLSSAVTIFYVGLIVASLLCGLTGAMLLSKSTAGRVVAVLGMAKMAQIAYHVGDTYIAAFAVTMSVVPLLLYFVRRGKTDKAFGIFLLCAGLAINLATWIRAQAGTPVLLFVLIALWFGVNISRRQKAVLTGCLFAGMLLPLLFFTLQLRQSDRYLSANGGLRVPMSSQHIFWHSAYIGLGFLDNEWGIRYKDEVGYYAAAAVKPDVVYCSADYEHILRTKTLAFVREHRFFFLETLAAKLGVLVFYLVCFANVGLLAAWRFPKPRALDAAFWLAMGLGSLSGLLVMPQIPYVLGAATLAAIYGIVSINTALESGRVRLFGRNPAPQ